MATVRPDGRPHLVPVWYVWHDEKIYIGMQPHSVKAKNLAHNPHLALSLEDGDDVVICEGTAVSIHKPYHQALINLFQTKYSWNIVTDAEHNYFIEVTPKKWLTWGGEPK